MPEGPELKLSSLYVNASCKEKIFTGKVLKSSVSKCSEITFSSPRYTITSESRGKEMALFLRCMENPQNTLRILFRFGMSGRFWFGPASDMQKHAHLNFFTADDPANVLSFVDARRFGSWHVMQAWGQERGPDPMYEYSDFRSNVLTHLDDSAFNRPICETLLNQKYFNGVGNYLRAEVLFRAGVPPFTRARDVLETLMEGNQERLKRNGGKACNNSDLLQLCHSVALEVIDLSVGLTDVPVVEDDYKPFVKWLRCYENPNMNRLSDHNKRTIWYKGEAGPLAPKTKCVRTRGKKQAAGVKRRRGSPHSEAVGGVAEGTAMGGVAEGTAVGGVAEGTAVGGVAEGTAVGGVPSKSHNPTVPSSHTVRQAQSNYRDEIISPSLRRSQRVHQMELKRACMQTNDRMCKCDRGLVSHKGPRSVITSDTGTVMRKRRCLQENGKPTK